MILGVLLIVVAVVLTVFAVGMVLAAPLWQEFSLREPEPLRASVTATVVPPIRSPSTAPGSAGRAGVARIIRGEIESRIDG